MDYQTIGVLLAATFVVIGVITWMFQIMENRRINKARLLDGNL